MAKPYQEGQVWSFRLRCRGQDIYRTGFASEAKAKRALEDIRVTLLRESKASGDGPFRTTLGEAFLRYGLERLPSLKGAPQDKNRINRYLRAVGLPTLTLLEIERTSAKPPYWEVQLCDESERKIPSSLGVHRLSLAENSTQSDAQRARLAAMKMADVTTYHIQALVDTMRSEGKGDATIALEAAELSRLFNHARAVWRWTSPGCNPVTDVKNKTNDNARTRVLTNEEWAEMSEKLAGYGNKYALPLLALMLETAMRSCEPLTYARWGHVNWGRRVLELPDAKTGKRDVPLNPAAIAILEELASKAGDYQPDEHIFPTTYEAVKKAWSQSREACGLSNIHIHDLRHTSATRYALEYKGNLPFIQVITGHKTVTMVMRYINIKADDVVTVMHGKEVDEDKAPAGYRKNLGDASLRPSIGIHRTEHVPEPLPEPVSEDTGQAAVFLPKNVVRFDFGRRQA